ncbi:MAG: type VI secretion system-associated FHA domain protein TagH [Gammaproteobacteria bacterium]|nr:type VI secretion system-associated FHA domain protein TagH [Gammaproteobacteria bacterium]
MGASASKVFAEAGGTIGRAAGNDWVLPDPERFLSGRHVIIRYMAGMFSLEDVSTNGTFINGQPESIGSRNEPVVLNSGDRLQIGDYEVYVNIVEEDSSDVPAPQYSSAPMDPMRTSPTSHNAYSTTTGGFDGGATIGAIDPLDLLGNAPPVAPSAPAAFSNHSSAMTDHFSPPGIPGGGRGDPGGIPDDWDLTDFGGGGSAQGGGFQPQPGPAQGLGSTGMMPQLPGNTGMMPQMPGNTGMMPQIPEDSGMGPGAAFGSGMSSAQGLPDNLMPLIVQGMMDILKSRADVKSQFRLTLTTIKPVENNPLKFSPNVDDAMEHLFKSQKPGYLRPTEAFEEGFRDIKAHQLAMIAGMRAAFEHMLEQFSPEVLEEYFEGGPKRGGFKAFNKVRYWDMYRDMFNRITRDSDDNFRKLFGEEFASAYEEQMHKITTRK